MILHLVRGKPLSKINTRYVPVYHQGAWRNLYLIKLGNFTLGLSTLVDKQFSGIFKGIEDFRLAFMASRLEIPSEVCVRLFTKTRNHCCFYEVLQIGMSWYFFIKILRLD
jgi:hypothetical protein